MSPVRRWVIGRGLLGRAVIRATGGSDVGVTIPWSDPDHCVTEIARGLEELTATGDRFEIYWCAGRGVTSTPAEELAVELRVFDGALAAVSRLPESIRANVTFFLASSVGGAYGGATEPPFTEATPPAPASAYGVTKLQMEASLRNAAAEGQWRAFVARITNLYGAGQDLAKPQGLISALVRGHLSGQPIPVYVPLDTLRDYIYEDDCAAVVVAAMDRLRSEPAGATVTKIVGTMRAVSIGALLGELTRLRRRRGAIILGGGDPRGQALDLRVRSEVWHDLDGLVCVTLPDGLGRVYQAQLSGRLAPH